MGKNIDKNISKNLSGKYSQTLFDPAKQSAEMHLKVIQKIAEATGDLIGTKIADRIVKSQEVHLRMIQKQLQMNTIKKYVKKDIYLQKKDTKLLMI